MDSDKPKIPRLISGVDVRSLPLAPMEGFVLSRIDASATLADIADLTSLDLEEVVRIVDKLIGLSVVEWADGQMGFPRASVGPRQSVAPRPTPIALSRPAIEPHPRNVTEIPRTPGPSDPAAQRSAVRVFAPPAPRAPKIDGAGGSSAPPPPGGTIPSTGTSSQPPPEPSTIPPDGPAAPPTDGIELSMERRKRIDDLYFALDLLNHYEVLGISRKADKAKIRTAYFDGSKAFHPDTVFRKNVGAYKMKMESIFSRLTEAYDALGKKKAREEYDAYLESLGETRAAEEALSGEHEVPKELREPEPPPEPIDAPQLPPTSLPKSPPPSPAKQSAPTEEGRRIAREVLQKRMDAMRSTSSSTSSSRSRDPEPATPLPPSQPAEPRSPKEALRDLTSSIRGAAALTGGLDQVARHVGEAKRAVEQNDLATAVRSYRLAMALAPDRKDIERDHAHYSKELAVSLADRYETQALYEERYKKWASAATSWAKVIEGRPDDAKAMTHAAVALVEAKGDLHQAQRFAQRATELLPNDAAARRSLGRVFLAAGLGLNARRELEAAKKLDPSDELTKLLLREVDAQRS